MSYRKVGLVADPVTYEEAENLTMGRSIGGERMVILDPILLLDHMRLDPKATRTVGFPRHPHRGIETLTYVFAGKVHHKDSLGNDSGVGPGGSQWMCAGGGIFHEEYLEPMEEGNDSLQIWFNLPAAEKRKPPTYHGVTGEEVPVATLEGGATARVIAGEVGGVRGAFEGIAVNPTYLDVWLPPNTTVELPAPAGETAFAYLYRGKVSSGESGTTITGPPKLVVFSEEGDLIRLASGEEEARFVFVRARPLREPVVQYRTNVMNSVEEIREALEDLERGTFDRRVKLEG
jgi:redox-sensitive bicupin YhaK (pirin superfamily)